MLVPGTNRVPGTNLPRKKWVTLKHLRTGMGLFNFNMFYWDLNDSPDHVCEKLQTAQHIINHCVVLGRLKEVDLAYSDEATSHWLKQL